MDKDKPERKTLRQAENLINEDRVINFSDGVFAFAATLLVLKIDLPTLTQTEIASPRLLSELFNLWPSYFANIISFLMIGYYWLTHHAIFSLIKKIDQKVIWLNIIFLIFLSFLPFPVDLFGEYNESHIIIIFYSISLSVTGFLLALIWFYSLKAGLTESLTNRLAIYYSLSFLVAPVVFAVSIPLALVDPLVSKISWIFVIIGTIVINKLFHFKNLNTIEKDTL